MGHVMNINAFDVGGPDRCECNSQPQRVVFSAHSDSHRMAIGRIALTATHHVHGAVCRA